MPSSPEARTAPSASSSRWRSAPTELWPGSAWTPSWTGKPSSSDDSRCARPSTEGLSGRLGHLQAQDVRREEPQPDALALHQRDGGPAARVQGGEEGVLGALEGL